MKTECRYEVSQSSTHTTVITKFQLKKISLQIRMLFLFQTKWNVHIWKPYHSQHSLTINGTPRMRNRIFFLKDSNIRQLYSKIVLFQYTDQVLDETNEEINAKIIKNKYHASYIKHTKIIFLSITNIRKEDLFSKKFNRLFSNHAYINHTSITDTSQSLV